MKPQMVVKIPERYEGQDLGLGSEFLIEVEERLNGTNRMEIWVRFEDFDDDQHLLTSEIGDDGVTRVTVSEKPPWSVLFICPQCFKPFGGCDANTEEGEEMVPVVKKHGITVADNLTNLDTEECDRSLLCACSPPAPQCEALMRTFVNTPGYATEFREKQDGGWISGLPDDIRKRLRKL